MLFIRAAAVLSRNGKVKKQIALQYYSISRLAVLGLKK